MNLEFKDGLLFVSLILEHNGLRQSVNNILLDTGAAQSLIDRDATRDLQLKTEDNDIVVTMAGIGGYDYAVRKQIDFLHFGSYSFEKPYMDFGNLDAHPGINGLLGSDILVTGKFIIDLDEMALYQRS